MGFQAADIKPLAKQLAGLDRVTGVWLLNSADDKTCIMWVTVAGFDAAAHDLRVQVYETCEAFIRDNVEDMRVSGLVFDYHVLADEPGLGSPQIPSGAVPIAA